jgi:uncharacterized protein YfcZ (UPF0381/DUF406 family)
MSILMTKRERRRMTECREELEQDLAALEPLARASDDEDVSSIEREIARLKRAIRAIASREDVG